jgi:hypothetical protein
VDPSIPVPRLVGFGSLGAWSGRPSGRAGGGNRLSADVEASAASSPRPITHVRKRDRYAEGLRRRIPDFRDLTLSEARVVAGLIDEVVVGGRRALCFGTRELEAVAAAIPRLGPRLRSWPAGGLAVSGPGTAAADQPALARSLTAPWAHPGTGWRGRGAGTPPPG